MRIAQPILCIRREQAILCGYFWFMLPALSSPLSASKDYARVRFAKAVFRIWYSDLLPRLGMARRPLYMRQHAKHFTKYLRIGHTLDKQQNYHLLTIGTNKELFLVKPLPGFRYIGYMKVEVTLGIRKISKNLQTRW